MDRWMDKEGYDNDDGEWGMRMDGDEDEDTIRMRKQELRRYMMSLRDSLSREEMIRASSIIQEKVLNTDEFNSSSIVGLYSPIGSEVDTSTLARYAIENGKVLAYPRIEDRYTMVFTMVLDPAIDLTIGRYGILEPLPSKVVKPDLVIVPGLVWDEDGYRIGYGKGYYDRYLSMNRDAVRIGLAYDFQVLSSIPHSRMDVRVNMIVTERRSIRVV
ncbi:MAG: 5-formyltetrahydrofolate cyclo-ligase [Candidatus Nitrosocaldus sp.]